MKKKGLIISTVVMVVILIASLTTATYAWFSSTAEARIAPIGMTANAAEGILIGVRADTTATTTTRDDFQNGDVAWTASATAGNYTDGTWKGTNGFGSLITPLSGSNPLSIQVAEAMTKTVTADASNADIGSAYFKKAPAGVNDQTAGKFTAASANVDYIQLDLGIIASTHKSIDQIIGSIKVTPTDTSLIGMAAAIHFEIAVKGYADTDWELIQEGGQDIDAFGTLESGYADWEKNTPSYGKLDSTTKVWTYDFGVWEGTDGDSLFTKAEEGVADRTLDVVQVRIRAWLEGTDNSCKTAYTGTGANIEISFNYSKTTTTNWTITNGVAAGGGQSTGGTETP